MSCHTAAITLLLCGMLSAEVSLQPYEVDSHTLHLWHLDESGPPFRNSVAGGAALQGMHNGAKAGESGMAGLGSAVSLNHNAGGTPRSHSLKGAIITLAPGLANGRGDHAPDGFIYQGGNGAFTCEAMVKFDRLPSEAESIALAILTMDGEDRERVFSFRIEREGFLSFTPLNDSGASGGAIASIPAEGPHAINTRDWFHVAASYDGRPGVPGAVQLYWTRVDRGRDEANRIGSGSLSRNLALLPGDFAVGNEARSQYSENAEAEPFPGLVDEVRISSVARHPTDFILVDPAKRVAGGAAEPAQGSGGSFQLSLTGVMVDGEPVPVPAGHPLSLPPGLHRLDFDLGAGSGFSERPVQLRSQLAGFDEQWQESTLGMSLTFEFLDENQKPVSQAQFNMTGSSPGWGTRLTESRLTPRRQVLYAPENASHLRVTLSSGAPDTSGSVGIDDLNLISPERPDEKLWSNGGFELGTNILTPMQAPTGWLRGGAEPAIALVTWKDSDAILSLIDGDQSMGGTWTSVQPLDRSKVGGRPLIVTWSEAYNVISGNQQRATFLNVPPGRYVFRAIGMTEEKQPESAGLAAEVIVQPHFWQSGWFWPAATACVISLLAVAVIRARNRRNRQRVREFAFQTALERDRTRIARDMHDDLGTRITVLNISASLASRALENEPERARKQLDKMSAAARGLVVAMDELVWAVDPSHDNLDELALRLTLHAEEVFHDSGVRYRFDIPDSLPPVPISSDFRHNVSMAVREALHNILKHAGPCEVTLAVRFDHGVLEVDIRDNGRGFALESRAEGHGLANFRSRFADLGGTCEIFSSPAGGTRVSFRCPVPEKPIPRHR